MPALGEMTNINKWRFFHKEKKIETKMGGEMSPLWGDAQDDLTTVSDTYLHTDIRMFVCIVFPLWLLFFKEMSLHSAET